MVQITTIRKPLFTITVHGHLDGHAVPAFKHYSLKVRNNCSPNKSMWKLPHSSENTLDFMKAGVAGSGMVDAIDFALHTFIESIK